MNNAAAKNMNTEARKMHAALIAEIRDAHTDMDYMRGAKDATNPAWVAAKIRLAEAQTAIDNFEAMMEAIEEARPKLAYEVEVAKQEERKIARRNARRNRMVAV